MQHVPVVDQPAVQDATIKVSSKLLSDLVNLCEAVTFKSFAESHQEDRCYHLSSFSEGKARVLLERPEETVRHTRRQLVRVYPAGSRASSSNYNAVPFWNVGCQLVALNYQTDDKEKSFYLGRFRANGNCGYVLKPQWLTADGTDLDRPADRLRSYFCVRIISGQNLPKVQGKPDGVVDPYVSLEVWGHPLDFFKFKTDNVDNNGLNPVWNETAEVFLRAPELAVVCLTVKDKDSFKLSGGRFIGNYALPFNSIKPGYRHVPLLMANGDPIPSATIFVHVAIKDLE